MTLAKLAPIALYGISVSWPYLWEACRTGDEIINLLDLTDFHHQIHPFCEHIASNPGLLLDPNSPLHEVSLDGKPFMDPMLVAAVVNLSLDLPDLKLMITALFSGAAEGWIQFTSEFEVGGVFDSLTPEQHASLFIPSANDANEGALGSWHVYVHYHPPSTAASFSSQA